MKNTYLLIKLSTTIESYIEYELNRLNIRPEQIINITTDNGSDFEKSTIFL